MDHGHVTMSHASHACPYRTQHIDIYPVRLSLLTPEKLHVPMGVVCRCCHQSSAVPIERVDSADPTLKANYRQGYRLYVQT